MTPQFIQFQEHGDERGNLVALEENINVPFQIRRVYFMYDTLEDVTRGMHSHRKLVQILFCVAGECMIRLDDGRDKVELKLNKPSEGLYIGPGIWREMYQFAPGTILMVLASEHYDERDYIRDYATFLEDVRANEHNE